MEFPITYKNGNVTVTIDRDGTKTCEWNSEEFPENSFPQSCDLKITNYCDLGDRYIGNTIIRSKTCEFCHEKSNNRGKHGDLDKIWSFWKNAKRGTELAIGGGNPLDHPDLDSFLEKLYRNGIIANITVNIFHIKKYSEKIKTLQDKNHIHGLGISYRGEESLKLLPDNIDYKNCVFHMILGIHDLNDCKKLISFFLTKKLKPKILFLGYKKFGNGEIFFNEEIEKKIQTWKSDIVYLLYKKELTASFDNLAIEQLELRSLLSEKMWKTFYMGDDGSSTLYCDAVSEVFSRTSTSEERFPISSISSLEDMMKKIKNSEE